MVGIENGQYLYSYHQSEVIDYQLKMLQAQTIPGLVEVEVVTEGEQCHLYYQVAKETDQSLEKIDSEMVGRKDYQQAKQKKELTEALRQICQCLPTYLLEPSRIVLQPEAIFYHLPSQSWRFIYLPVREKVGDLEQASNFLTNHLGLSPKQQMRVAMMAEDKTKKPVDLLEVAFDESTTTVV